MEIKYASIFVKSQLQEFQNLLKFLSVNNCLKQGYPIFFFNCLVNERLFMQENEFYKKLVSRYAENQATIKELEVFFQLLKEGKLDTYLTDKMKEEISDVKESEKVPVRLIPTWTRIAAASVILIIAVGLFYFINQKPTDQLAHHSSAVSKLMNDAAPGGNKAVLILADGSKIILESAEKGTLSQQGDIQIIKLDDGRLSYNNGQGKKSNEILYNTIATPKGGQYQLTLSDGSKVWLNAQSSIRFPASFTGDERKVEMTGEGFFEIAHNATMPFKVSVDGLEVEVLGTHFNVNAYKDEPEIKTTLLNGSVKVKKGIASRIIKPGEQAVLNNKNEKIQIVNPDMEEVLAWKNGLFYFDGASIQFVMRQLARWYDVNVIYEGDLKERRFGGEIQKNLKLSQVLKLLEKNNIHFSIVGKNIIVRP